jgi:hypothetical protein
MQSKIDQDVIDELISMLEDHIAGGMKKPEIPSVDDEKEEGDSSEGGPEHEASESKSKEEDEEDLKKLMEHYSRG